jgi:hypothetical protein
VLCLQTVESDEVDEGEEDDFNFYQIGDKTLRISTAHTEEKTNALQMLSCYAEHLQEHFAPYCGELAKIVEHVMTVPLLNDEEMRGTCASVMPCLLEDLQLAQDKGIWDGANDNAVREMYTLLMRTLFKVCCSLHAWLPHLTCFCYAHVRDSVTPAR